MTPLNITYTPSGLFRVFNFGNPKRVWIGRATSFPVFPDTIINLKDAHGNVDEALAGDVQFDHITIKTIEEDGTL